MIILVVCMLCISCKAVSCILNVRNFALSGARESSSRTSAACVVRPPPRYRKHTMYVVVVRVVCSIDSRLRGLTGAVRHVGRTGGTNQACPGRETPDSDLSAYSCAAVLSSEASILRSLRAGAQAPSTILASSSSSSSGHLSSRCGCQDPLPPRRASPCAIRPSHSL